MIRFRTVKNKVKRRIAGTRFGNRFLSLRDIFEKNKTVIFEYADLRRRAVRMSIYSSDLKGLAAISESGFSVSMDDPVTCRTMRGTRIYFWLTFPEETSSIFMTYRGKAVKFRGRMRRADLGVLSFDRCAGRGDRETGTMPRFPLTVRIIRDAAMSEAMRNRFGDCWVLADRADKADDNAEHFYRFLQSQPSSPKIFFVLDKSSPDWNRLSKDGFNLIEFRSLDHVSAVVNARHVISSQATPVLRYPIAEKFIGDLCKFDFIFLQHGIIASDCSRWINQHTYRYFVSSTPEEYAELTDARGPYNLSTRNVVLSGLARHDNLFNKKDEFEKNLIAVMPTWRAYLARPAPGENAKYIIDRRIKNSDYARNWLALLHSDEVRNICLEMCLRIALLPHPNIRFFFEEEPLPDHIFVPSIDTSYQDIILRSALCITDYSSVANDMAAVGVPIIHYAFYEKMMEAGRHTSSIDIGKLEAMGMGPVLKEEKQVVMAIRHALDNPNADDEYKRRRERAFVCCDGNACGRIYDIIKADATAFGS